jgi:activator of HSP90 ATPase
MANLKQTYKIAAPVADVWQALVDPKIIDAWGGGPAVMDANKDTEFTLWGGSIHGKNVDVAAEKKLVQDWYSEDWPEPSKAVFELFAENNGTRLEFTHENVPDADAKEIDDGWRDFYLGPIKDYLENR